MDGYCAMYFLSRRLEGAFGAKQELADFKLPCIITGGGLVMINMLDKLIKYFLNGLQ